jgi:DNA repair exonuclease SbcCD ATPase subunit
MKITKLVIHNVGKIADTDIALDLPLLLFYGQVCAGKSTILNAVRWACGGEFPADIIRHGAVEAFVELAFAGGSIRREWYIGRDNSTKARAIKFTKDGRVIDQPAAAIKLFLNPFLLDQDHLRKMNEIDRKRFFVEQFGVDTKELDAEKARLDQEEQVLRAEIRGYGTIDVAPVARIDVAESKRKRAEILDAHAEQVTSIKQINKATIEANHSVQQNQEAIETIKVSIVEAKKNLATWEDTLTKLTIWLAKNPKEDPLPVPPPPDVSALDAAISDASANEVRFEQYQKNLARVKEQSDKSAELRKRELRQFEIQREKAAKLKGLSDKCGVPGLAFDENGDFTYEETTAGMLSTSQIMRLSSAVASLYPEGFGLDLLDRGESLGRAIFDYIERAKAKNTTILATIVGERPAKVPAGVGVFVVEDGIVIKENEQ